MRETAGHRKTDGPQRACSLNELLRENSHPALKPACGAAFSIEVADEERLVVVQEIDRHLQPAEVDAVMASIRQRLAEEHEINLHAVVLVQQGSLPKTSSGTIQHRACAQAFLAGQLAVVAEWREPSGEPPGAPSPTEAQRPRDVRLSAAAIETFLIQRLSAQLCLPPDEIDIQQPFNAFGLDSAQAVALLGELETQFGLRLSPILLWNYPTIMALAQHVTADAGGTVSSSLATAADQRR